ncbi:MAG: UDP-N-acetylmuramate dehydrogenase [Patescibacteria group bacterium]|jgi:UDP-N-acetylmuramate dehydrogenase
MIKENIQLNDYTHYKIGGPARYFLEVSSTEELIGGLKDWHAISTDLPPEARKRFVLGSGTNLLVDDRGYNGLIIRNSIKFKNRDGNEVVFGGGLLFQEAIDFCIENSLSGIEWAGGLPGTVGGAVRGNAGAFGGETKDTVLEVESINLTTTNTIVRNNHECRFAYRHSIYKTDAAKDELITSAKFSLTPGNKEEIERIANEKIAYRNSRQPLRYPSAGSTFKNIDCAKAPADLVKKSADVIKNDPFPVIPVAHLLSECDLKGKSVGGAMISDMHPNFIVNTGNATASDIMSLIKMAQAAVQSKFNVSIEPEIMYLEY